MSSVWLSKILWRTKHKTHNIILMSKACIWKLFFHLACTLIRKSFKAGGKCNNFLNGLEIFDSIKVIGESGDLTLCLIQKFANLDEDCEMQCRTKCSEKCKVVEKLATEQVQVVTVYLNNFQPPIDGIAQHSPVAASTVARSTLWPFWFLFFILWWWVGSVLFSTQYLSIHYKLFAKAREDQNKSWNQYFS